MVDGRRNDPDAALLASLTRLTARWSSADFQHRVSRAVGLDLDNNALRAVYITGLLGQARASTIADELHLTRPTASKLISRLEAAGVITRVSDAEDGRARNISLTELGNEKFGLLVDAGIDMVRSATTNWAADERRRFADLLAEFVEQLVDDRSATTSRAEGASSSGAETPPPGKEE